MSNGPSPTQDDLVSIGDVAEATGLTPETLRIWERRYGRPRPVRLPSGHRRYTRRQILWLRSVAEALARGHRPAQIVPMDDAALAELLEVESGEPSTHLGVEEMLSAVAAMDRPAISQLLERWWQASTPLEFLEERLAPALEAIGRQWAEGQIGVRHEHFASEVISDVLRGLRHALPPASDDSPHILLATLSGELHGLGLQMAALLCAIRGLRHDLLGTDTPTEQIAEAARERGVDAVALSVSLSSGGVATDREIAALRDALPDATRLVVGGAGARRGRRGPRGVDYAESLAAWDAWLSEMAA